MKDLIGQGVTPLWIYIMWVGSLTLRCHRMAHRSIAHTSRVKPSQNVQISWSTDLSRRAVWNRYRIANQSRIYPADLSLFESFARWPALVPISPATTRISGYLRELPCSLPLLCDFWFRRTDVLNFNGMSYERCIDTSTPVRFDWSWLLAILHFGLHTEFHVAHTEIDDFFITFFIKRKATRAREYDIWVRN